MKKVIIASIAFLGMSFGTANAQSCCTTKNVSCKPVVCCNATTKSLNDNSTSLNNKKTNESRKVVSSSKIAKNKTLATKKDLAIIEPKKEN